MAGLVLLALIAQGDPLQGERRFVSPKGKHYVVVRRAGKEMEFELVRRRAGAGALKKAPLRDPRDELVVSGRRPPIPVDLFVLDKEAAVVLFETYGEIGKRVTLAVLDHKARLKWKLGLKELFDREFEERRGQILWWRGWWVDEENGHVVLAAKGGGIRTVDLASGRVTTARNEILLHGFRLPWARRAALEIAAELRPDGLRAAAEPLAADGRLPPGVRLRAAIAVQRGGGPAAPLDLFRTAAARSQPLQDRRHAVQHATDLEFLEEMSVRADVSVDALESLSARGDEAVPILIAALMHEDVEAGPRNYAAQLLGEMDAAAVLAAVVKEFPDADPDTAVALLQAAIGTGSKTLHRRLQPYESELIALFPRKGAPVGWLADHFKVYSTTEAVQPLLAAFGRHQRNAALRTKLRAALKNCTGLDFGDSYRAWQRGLSGR